LETLSSLMDAAQERKKITTKLLDDYQGFLNRFDDEVANVSKFTNSQSSSSISSISSKELVSTTRQTGRKTLFLNIININISCLFGYGVYRFSRNLKLESIKSFSLLSFLSRSFLGRQDDSSNNDSIREDKIIEDYNPINEENQ